MSSGLAFGAISRAAPRIGAAEFSIAHTQSIENINRQIRKTSKATKKKGDFWSTVGTIAGFATLAIPGVNLLGAAMLSGVGAGVGKKYGIQEGIKKSGLDSFKPRFHKEEVRQAKSDIRASAQQQGLSTAINTALTAYSLGKAAPGLADFIKNMATNPAALAKQFPGISNLPELTKFATPGGPSFNPALSKIASQNAPINPLGARFASVITPPATNPFGFDGDLFGLGGP